jgi:hypothetical protein
MVTGQLPGVENTTPPERNMIARRCWHFRGQVLKFLAALSQQKTCQSPMTESEKNIGQCSSSGTAVATNQDNGDFKLGQEGRKRTLPRFPAHGYVRGSDRRDWHD